MTQYNFNGQCCKNKKQYILKHRASDLKEQNIIDLPNNNNNNKEQQNKQTKVKTLTEQE